MDLKIPFASPMGNVSRLVLMTPMQIPSVATAPCPSL